MTLLSLRSRWPRQRRVLTWLAAATAAVAMVSSAVHNGRARGRGEPRFLIRDLGTLGGSSSEANGINNRGWIVGHSRLAENRVLHAFLYRGGRTLDLGTLGGRSSSATAVNGQGEVVGDATTHRSAVSHPFLFTHGRMMDLSPLSTKDTIAFAINDLAVVVGGSGEGRSAFVYAGKLHALGALPGDAWSTATGINKRGTVVGDSGPEIGVGRPFLWRNGILAALNLGVHGRIHTSAISDQDAVIGYSGEPPEATHAFLWKNHRLQWLPELPGFESSQASAINSRGDIVGQTLSRGDTHAVLWRDGQVYDLNSLIPKGPAWELIRANGINDHGQIVGGGELNGHMRAFLLSPS